MIFCLILNLQWCKGSFIDEGKLSLTGNHKLELILKLLEFKIIDIISNNLKYGQSFLDNDTFTYLPDIRKLGIEDIDEKQFYKMIGLTHDEIQLFDGNNNDIKSIANLEYEKKTLITEITQSNNSKKTKIELLDNTDIEPEIKNSKRKIVKRI